MLLRRADHEIQKKLTKQHRDQRYANIWDDQIIRFFIYYLLRSNQRNFTKSYLPS